MKSAGSGCEVSYRIGSGVDLQIAIQNLSRQGFLKKLSDVDLALISTIASELGTNIVKYVGRGSLRVCCAERMNSVYVDIWAEDHGKGIESINSAMTDRFSTGGTLGMGLPGVKRMSDEFWIRSEPGKGTLVFARKVFRSGPVRSYGSSPSSAQSHMIRIEEGKADRYAYSIGWRPYPGNPFTGDAACVVNVDSGCLMAMLDVSGHGRGASHLAQKVTEILRRYRGETLERVFQGVHELLQGTVGAALGLAYIDGERNILQYAAVGNIRAVIVSGEKA